MKYESKNSLIFSVFVTGVAMIMTGNAFDKGDMVVYGQAVDLIPIQSGNATLDNGLPEFYDCIEDKIDESKGVEEDPYFEDEPTKHEVAMCYNEVLVDGTDVQSSSTEDTDTDVQSSSTEDTDTDVQSSSTEDTVNSDIERFNELFGTIR
ncbi:MAG: MSCRAMM family adhesin SdrC [Candidatus Nitrosocosmicus sp.]|nr:MSCRAMM family adhesin SdrC [Candidatus Nitrosocosmicus sp.]